MRNRILNNRNGVLTIGLLTALLTASATKAFADDRAALVGTWRITVFQDDGNDRLARLGVGPAKKKGDEPRFAKLVFTADSCYLIRGDGRREMASGLTNAGWKACRLDESTAPKSIDIDGFTGKENEKTKTYPGIYEIDGDRLRICYAETSPKRPTKFESNGNDNLFECMRISKEPLPVPE
jgi:uncharacterized protein (TIGR03067 family)